MSISSNNTTELTVYGSETCPFTVRAREWLADWNVPYRFVDVDNDAEAEALIASWNNDRSIRPTIDVAGQILVNPELGDLQNSLRTHGFLSA